MESRRANRLDRPVELAKDHVLGPADAEVTLVEYGSYVCAYCHTAHNVIRRLRDDFGDRLRYVYRHLPLTGRKEAARAAELAEYVAQTTGEFWPVHDRLMGRGPVLAQADLDHIAAEFSVPERSDWDPAVAQKVAARVRADARSGLDSGARVTPTFFINGRRYEGAWDEVSLSEAMLRSLGHRIHAASVDFVRWAPSTGLLLLVMTVAALLVSNSPAGASFLALWEQPLGIRFGDAELALSLLDWMNNGLLTVFFLVVGLEIKRELTVGRLATRQAAALPLAAAVGGMIAPALIFLLVAPASHAHAWGMTITTDTAFAIALLVVLGDRVPVDLRVFLTAAVIADDLVAIALVALFYSGALHVGWVGVSAAVVVGLITLNRWSVYGALPYALLGTLLWFALHESGVHATLAGVVLAAATPTRPPANLGALLAQAQAVIDAETRLRGDAVMRTGPSDQTLRALDAVHDRIESPASKMLRGVEPWSSYFVLPIFALANAGLMWSADVLVGRGRLVAAIVLALVVGKFLGILLGARVATALGIAVKPAAYNWRQVAGTGALAGIGFTMSLFIARQALTGADFDAAKVAIFLASMVAGALGIAMLWTRVSTDGLQAASEGRESSTAEVGTAVATMTSLESVGEH
jgi:NhaA family Na+:H+ antiporter